MHTLRHCILAGFSFATLLVLWGCNHHSTANPATDVSTFPKIIDRAIKDKRYTIMQSGVNVYTITSFDMDQAKKQMTVTLDKVDSLRLADFKNRTTRQSQADQDISLRHEIFVMMKDSTSYTLDEPHTIPVERIARIEVAK